MKSFIYLFLVTLSVFSAFSVSSASADELGMALCGRMTMQGMYKSCVDVAMNATFQRSAVFQCDRMQMQGPLLDCVKLIADKTFDDRDLKACDNYTTQGAVLECIERAEIPQ